MSKYHINGDIGGMVFMQPASLIENELGQSVALVVNEKSVDFVHRVNTWESVVSALKMCHKGFASGKLQDLAYFDNSNPNAPTRPVKSLAELVKQIITQADAGGE